MLRSDLKKCYSIRDNSGKTVSMSLCLKKDSEGALRPFWYARFVVEGMNETAILCRWKGVPPADGNADSEGDAEFEESRLDAEEQLQLLLLKLHGHYEDFINQCRLYSRRFENEIKVADTWKLFSDQQDLDRCSVNHVNNLKRMTQRFVDFLSSHHPEITDLEKVTGAVLNEFLSTVCEEYHLSNRSYNEHLKLLKRIYETLLPYSEANEWLKRVSLRKENDAVSREFFTNEELVQILDVSKKSDMLIYQMVVIASCTGLRLKDICYLKWGSINLEHNRIHLTTYKTKQDATVGLWPLLRKLLDSLWNPSVRPEDYILPEAARQYSHNSANLLERLRKVLVACGYENARKPCSIRALQHSDLEQLSKEETIERVESALEKSDWTARRRRMALLYFRSYMKGLTLDEIAKGLDRAKGGISVYLSELEKLTHCAIIRRPAIHLPDPRKGKIMAEIPENGQRARRGSLRGWHSFKSSFVINALRAGVTLDTLSKILGNKTVSVLFNHYVKIDDNHMMEAFTSKTPEFAQ